MSSDRSSGISAGRAILGCTIGFVSTLAIEAAINLTSYNPRIKAISNLGRNSFITYACAKEGIKKIHKTFKANKQTAISNKIVNIICGTAMLAIAAYAIYDSINNVQKIFSGLHSNEMIMKEIVGESALEFDEKDPRQKLLYLSAEADHNRAHVPSEGGLTIDKYLFNQKLDTPFKELNELYDIKFKVFNSIDQICHEISDNAGPVDSLWINAHGNPLSMMLTDSKSLDVFSSIPQNCFSNLTEKAKIYLISCNTGAGGRGGIAAYLAKKANRAVVACNQLMYRNLIKVFKSPDGQVKIDFFNLDRVSSCLRIFEPNDFSSALTEKNIEIGFPNSDRVLSCIRTFKPNFFSSALYFGKDIISAAVPHLIVGLGVIVAAKILGTGMNSGGRFMNKLIDKAAPDVRQAFQKYKLYTKQRADSTYNMMKRLAMVIERIGCVINKSAAF